MVNVAGYSQKAVRQKAAEMKYYYCEAVAQSGMHDRMAADLGRCCRHLTLHRDWRCSKVPGNLGGGSGSFFAMRITYLVTLQWL